MNFRTFFLSTAVILLGLVMGACSPSGVDGVPLTTSTSIPATRKPTLTPVPDVKVEVVLFYSPL